MSRAYWRGQQNSVSRTGTPSRPSPLRVVRAGRLVASYSGSCDYWTVTRDGRYPEFLGYVKQRPGGFYGLSRRFGTLCEAMVFVARGSK